MIIGVDDGIIAFFSAQKLNGSVGNDLVGVHIGRGTGTALNGVYNKLTVQLSGYDFITGADNSLTDLFTALRRLSVSRSGTSKNCPF